MAKKSNIYVSPKEHMSRYEVARHVKRGLEAYEEETGQKIDEETKRLLIRHEVAHHIPREEDHESVRVRVPNHPKDSLQVSLSHYSDEPSLINDARSLIAPLFDKRFKQELSERDLQTGWEALKGFFKR